MSMTSKHLKAFSEFMARTRAMALAEPSPRRRAILLNFNRHSALEFSDRWPEIFTPEMTVAEPEYHVKMRSDSIAEFSGEKSVKGFYSHLNEVVVWGEAHQIFVNDWGLATYSVFNQFATAEQALELGLDSADDPDATYLVRCRLAMFWAYDENAKLLGEDLYQLSPFELSKPAPEDVFTFEERAFVLGPYFDFVDDIVPTAV